MQELMKTTITSMEVAEMVEKRHADLLKDIRKYVRQLNQGNISPVDFFTESVRIDIKGQQQPCYLVTKKGCEFIAHKMTGQKGTEFTARYINRFHEMEYQVKRVPLTEHPGEVANLIKVLSARMDKQGSAPYKTSEMVQMICNQYGIQLPDDFVKLPEYEQMELSLVQGGGVR